jgi:YqaJ-like recombinase protein
MLKKSHISNIEIYTPEWHRYRLGKFTSSRMHHITGMDGWGRGADSYVYQKVGEELTGISNDKEFEFDEDLDWGKKYEPEAIAAFIEKMGVELLVTQKLITNEDTRFSSTPDAIWVHGECKIDTNEYNVSTAEGKCPRTYHNFIPKFLCKTPADLYKLNKSDYWQVIDQMDQAGAAIGCFFVFHPYFPEGSNLNIITFKKMELWEQFKLLSVRKKMAVQKFEEIRLQMLGLTG